MEMPENIHLVRYTDNVATLITAQSLSTDSTQPSNAEYQQLDSSACLKTMMSWLLLVLNKTLRLSSSPRRRYPHHIASKHSGFNKAFGRISVSHDQLKDEFL